MTVLHSVDFFPSGNASVAIEPRLPQADFPEHHHDFHEIVIVEHGTGIHVFNGQPYTITGGTVCFVRDHDRHLYEHTDNLCLTNVLYRSPDRFQFLAGLNQLLPQELDGQYPSHWRVNHSVLQQVRQLVAQMEQQEGENDLPSTASREILFMQLLLLLRKSSLQENLENSASRLNLLLAWLEDHFADEVNWDAVADQFSLSLRTLHRQLKQQTGLTPQRYLNRLRLMKARHLLRHSEASEAQAAEWLKAQRQTGAAWVELAKELREVAAEVSSAAQSARSASRGWHWKLWLTVMLASMMPTVVLLIASLLLLDLTPLTTEDGSIWLRLVAR